MHLRKAYGDLRLQAKLMLTLALSVGIPLLVLGFFLAPQVVGMNISHTIRTAQDQSAEVVPRIEETLREISSLADAIEAEPFFEELFGTPQKGPLSDRLSGPQALAFARKVSSLTQGSPAETVRLYLSGAGESLSGAPELFQDEARIAGTYWHGILHATHPAELYCPPAYLGPREREALGELLYLRPLSYRSGETSRPAYLAVYFPSSSLTGLLSQDLELPGSVSYLLNERNEIAATTNSSLSGIYFLSYDAIEGTLLFFNHFIERQVLGEMVYAGYYRIEKADWLMVTVLPEKELSRQARNTMRRLYAAILSTLGLAVFLFSYLSKSLTGRIALVSAQMQAAKGSLPLPLTDSPQYQDEVGELIDAYNDMARRINQLSIEQARAAEDLRIAEFHSLQAQMNPHFLYNAMDMIHWMAMQGQTQQISETVRRLSRFYRLTLSKKEGIWSIEEEVEHASIYLELQNMRFGNRITYVVDVPDELYHHKIPKLTLQPVVENAILHGLLETEQKGGTIVLTGWQEEGDVVLLVSDDGAGMDRERLSSILTGKGQSSSGGTNIAVYNTHRRLELLYGKGYGLSYKSAPGEGCEVTIRFPVS